MRAVADPVARGGASVAGHDDAVARSGRRRRWCRGVTENRRSIGAVGRSAEQGRCGAGVRRSLAPGRRPELGEEGRLIGPVTIASADGLLLAALLDVGLHEVLGVGLEHVVDLVEQVVELRLDLLPWPVDAGASSTSSSRRCGAGFFLSSRSAMVQPPRRGPPYRGRSTAISAPIPTFRSRVHTVSSPAQARPDQVAPSRRRPDCRAARRRGPRCPGSAPASGPAAATHPRRRTPSSPSWPRRCRRRTVQARSRGTRPGCRRAAR